MEISITKALRELKTLDARILKKINETTFAASKKPKENIRGFKTVEEFEKEAKESYTIHQRFDGSQKTNQKIDCRI